MKNVRSSMKYQYKVEQFGNGFTVFVGGDEVYFDTKEEAELFAESLMAEEEQ